MQRTSVLLLFLMILISGCGSDHQERSGGEENLPPLSVRIAPVERVMTPVGYEAVGSVEAKTSAILSAKIMGYVTQISVDAGDRVQKGQTLVRIDPREGETQLRQAEARVGEAKAALEEVDRTIQASESVLRAAEANARLARATFERFEELRERRSVSQQEFDEVEARRAAAEAEVERARGMLESARAKREQVKSRIVQAEAGVEGAHLMVGYTTVEAPFSGYVTRKTAEAGQLASPGAPLLTIEDPRSYRLEAIVDESQIRFLQMGQEVEVQIDSLDSTVAGKLGEIVPAADSASRSVKVKVSLPPIEGLKSGLFGRARFRTRERPVLVAPASALIERGQLTGVYRVDTERRAHFRLVKTGKRIGEQVEILSGLQTGDEVILDPDRNLRDGQKVVATPDAGRGRANGEGV